MTRERKRQEKDKNEECFIVMRCLNVEADKCVSSLAANKSLSMTVSQQHAANQSPSCYKFQLKYAKSHSVGDESGHYHRHQ